MRTSTISSISYINDRNRKRNVEEAEKAILVNFYLLNQSKDIISVNYEMYIQEELKANKGKKIDDPFTRRSTKPCMKFRAKPNDTDTSIVPELEESKNNVDSNDTKVCIVTLGLFFI